jgi:lysophospholipase L1-like esterase
LKSHPTYEGSSSPTHFPAWHVTGSIMKHCLGSIPTFAVAVLLCHFAAAQTPPPVVDDTTNAVNATNSAPHNRGFRGFNIPADKPAPRTDRNSQIVHEQLVEKAKQGGIDIYFVGDSITRRWGTKDPQYRQMLENWTTNFFGWNAGNFGWGADGIQNILWRLENGELDGVNPRIIVVLAGINNVGRFPGGDEKVANITHGLEAIVKVCQEKAPNAVIVLTGLFPRNDSLAVIPEINNINDHIARIANGKTIRYLNVNDKLADKDGKLFPGMSQDKLHPTVKGYQVWADGLKPIFTEILGPPARTDHAPPPTGDPSATPQAAAPTQDQQGK